MKKISIMAIVAILILTATFSVLQSGTALAANGPADVSVTVKNLTGGTVTVRLTDENNESFWFTFEGQGMYKVSVPEGRYSYFASTPCGSESGEFNLNVSKSLKFYCEEGLGVSLTKHNQSCEMLMWLDFAQWYETDPFWVEIFMANGAGEMRCYDGVSPIVPPYPERWD